MRPSCKSLHPFVTRLTAVATSFEPCAISTKCVAITSISSASKVRQIFASARSRFVWVMPWSMYLPKALMMSFIFGSISSASFFVKGLSSKRSFGIGRVGILIFDPPVTSKVTRSWSCPPFESELPLPSPASRCFDPVPLLPPATVPACPALPA